MFQQHGREIYVAVLRCAVQCRKSGFTSSIHIDMMIEQQRCYGAVVIERCELQCCDGCRVAMFTSAPCLPILSATMQRVVSTTQRTIKTGSVGQKQIDNEQAPVFGNVNEAIASVESRGLHQSSAF